MSDCRLACCITMATLQFAPRAFEGDGSRETWRWQPSCLFGIAAQLASDQSSMSCLGLLINNVRSLTSGITMASDVNADLDYSSAVDCVRHRQQAGAQRASLESIVRLSDFGFSASLNADNLPVNMTAVLVWGCVLIASVGAVSIYPYEFSPESHPEVLRHHVKPLPKAILGQTPRSVLPSIPQSNRLCT